MRRPGRPTPPLTLSNEERETLEAWTRRPKTAQALALRARIIPISCDATIKEYNVKPYIVTPA